MNNRRDGAFANHCYASPETIWKAVAGDPDACKEIRDIYQEEAENFAKALLRKNKRKDRDIPLEDILQTAWMGVFQNSRNFRGK